MTSPSSITALVSDLARVDILINNAGVSVPRPCLDLEIETTVKTIFEANVFGVMRVVQAVAPLLIASEGTIVNIGSIAPVVPLVFGGAYNASKAALHAYADCLRMELAPFKFTPPPFSGWKKRLLLLTQHPQRPRPHNHNWRRPLRDRPRRLAVRGAARELLLRAHRRLLPAARHAVAAESDASR